MLPTGMHRPQTTASPAPEHRKNALIPVIARHRAPDLGPARRPAPAGSALVDDLAG